jgi:heme exporter protein C
MWKIFYPLVSAQRFYALTAKILPVIAIITLVLFGIGLIWGLGFAPADYQQGDAFRIIYVHVPCAFFSMALFAAMGWLALVFLVWRIKIAGIMLGAFAETGAWMTLLALITGSIWGKPMWGAWWVWDARLTSELILLLLYGAILAVRNAYQMHEQGDKVVAILVLIGLIDLPIIHYSVYWWNTLHQGSTILALAKPKIAASMLYPLLIMLLAFFGYCVWVILYKARQDLLLRERQQKWVLAYKHEWSNN